MKPTPHKSLNRRPNVGGLQNLGVTPGDLRRISRVVGELDFFELRPPLNPAYADHGDDPAWARAVFRPDGSRRVLRHRDHGDCGFLGATGCELPATAKPLICRIYPYEYADGLVTGLATTCPTPLLGAEESLPAAVGMPPIEECARWVAQLYRELREEEHGAGGGETARP